MIAKTEIHFPADLLQRLLDEQLPRARAIEIEQHLGCCAQCRQRLEQLAGDGQWWEETVEVLTHKHPTQAACNSESIGDESGHPCWQWVQPILESSTHGLGLLDEYEIQGVIGQGGMGVVLRGIDPQLNRPVAIKVLSPHLAGVGAARNRFMREAQSAASVVHPSIVPIYRVVTEGKLPYLVMPCIDGGNLQQRIDHEGPLELGEVLRIGRQVAEGLAAAHRLGVIHRDIKPANILVEEGNGRVLISDFGLARAIDDASLTVSGMIAGTPQYMSPEQARGDAIDARSDLFSLGGLMYCLATARPPFRADNPLAVLKKITEGSPRPVHEINEQVPPWFSRLVAELMQLDRRKRIATASEAADLLTQTQSHVSNPAVHHLPTALTSGRSFKALKPIAVLMLSLFFAGTLYLSRSPQDVPQVQGIVAPDAESVPADVTIPASDAELDWNDSAMQRELDSMQMQLERLHYETDFSFPGTP